MNPTHIRRFSFVFVAVLVGCLLVVLGPATAADLERSLRDTFDVPNSNDINFQNALGRQSGSAGVVSYAENTGGATDALSRIASGALLLEATATQNYTAATLNYNFNEGGTFTLDFDLDAGIDDAANSSGDWACIVFGASSPAPVFVNASDGMGILFRNSGPIQVFDGGTSVFAGGAVPTGPFHVHLEVSTGDFAGTSPATVRMFIDGAEVQIGASTLEYVKPAGFKANYITLGGSAFGGNHWTHSFDNLEIAAQPCIRSSPSALASYPGQTGQAVTVTIPASLNAGGAIAVTVTSTDPAVAEPVGGVAGSLVLNFPPGTTSRSFDVSAHQKGLAALTLSSDSGGCIEGATTVKVGSSLVRNPSFEENFNSTWPHYGPIDQWTQIPGGNTGVNESDGPFHDNSTIPDRTRVALHQGSGGISQTVNGLVPGQQYWLQFRYNRRQGGAVGLSTRFAGVELDNIPSIPVAGANPYFFRNIMFTPAASSGLLEFRSVVPPGVDATLLLDGVTLVPRGNNQVIVANPSFEASGTVPFPGYISPAAISGWTGVGTYGVNVSPDGPFADNGVNPDQDSVAFIQNVGSLSQVLSNLVIGQTYKLSYSFNARAGNLPFLRVSIDGSDLFLEQVTPVDGTAPYYRVTNEWVATVTSAELQFAQVDDLGDQTVLIDDVRVEGLALPPCAITASVESFDLFANQPIGPASVQVGLPLYLVATSAVDVVVISLNPNVAVPTGAAGDRLTLHFPRGNTTNMSFSITGVGSGVTTFTVTSVTACAGTEFSVRNRSSLVLNPSFEDNSLPQFPGYGAINDWQGGSGVNTATQPFADNGTIPDRAQVGFVQGSGSMSQLIRGLTPGQSYWLQFGYNSRNCCTPGLALDLNVRFGGVVIGSVSNIVGGGYQPSTMLFTPTNSTGLLEFVASVAPGGDRTLLLDAVNIVPRGPADGVVLNASFEGTGLVSAPGYVSPAPIGGWLGSGNYGVNISGAGPFADNGRGPDQDNVLFLQDAASLSTMVGPLALGARYRFSYSYNARNGNRPHLRVTLGDFVPQDADITAVGGNAPYAVQQFEFVATNLQMVLTFAQTVGGDQTLLVDNVRLEQLSPGGVRLSISLPSPDTVRLAWPLWVTEFDVEYTDSLAPATWTPLGSPIFVEDPENAVYDLTQGGARFYRLTARP
jgi:hypothetical protein